MTDNADSSQFYVLHVFMICWCNEKELSKIIPRFLSDLLNSIGMPFICKDKGKDETYLSVVWLSVLLPFCHGSFEVCCISSRI